MADKRKTTMVEDELAEAQDKADRGEMSEEEYAEHMDRVRSQSISQDFDKLLERIQGGTLYGETVDLTDLQEVAVVCYALGLQEGIRVGAQKAVEQIQKFKYTRRPGEAVSRIFRPPGIVTPGDRRQ